MSAFRVGQKVVCVDDGTKFKGVIALGLRTNLERGAIYTVTGHHEMNGRAFVDLAETAPPAPWRSFLASLFRPLVTRKTDISIFTALLNTKSEKELV